MPGRRIALALGLWRGGMVGKMAKEILVIGDGSGESGEELARGYA